MIKYVIQAKKNPLKKNEIKYYPQMAPTTPMSLAQIVKRDLCKSLFTPKRYY